LTFHAEAKLAGQRDRCVGEHGQTFAGHLHEIRRPSARKALTHDPAAKRAVAVRDQLAGAQHKKPVARFRATGFWFSA